MKIIQLLSTKKLPPNQKHLLLSSNFSIIEADFIEIKTKKVPIKELGEALIFTSQNAVLPILNSENIKDLRNKKIFCVGIKTKKLLEENHFVVEIHTNYAEELADIISSNYPYLNYTFFSGNLRQDILPKKLKDFGIIFNEIEIYETILAPQKISTKLDGILFYSPSGVKSYLKNNKITDEICFCIGTTTAKALKNITKNIIVTNQPSIENVIIQCLNYYKLTCSTQESNEIT